MRLADLTVAPHASMHTSLRLVGLLLAVLGSTYGAEMRKNANLNTLLFYTCVTPQVGNQCEEGMTLDQAGIATRGVSSNFSTIKAAKAVNITTLFAVHDTFFSNGKGLRKDWQQAWAALQPKLKPLIEERTVVGFFVGDELFPGKAQPQPHLQLNRPTSPQVTVEEFTTALNALQSMKTKCPLRFLLRLNYGQNVGILGW